MAATAAGRRKTREGGRSALDPHGRPAQSSAQVNTGLCGRIPAELAPQVKLRPGSASSTTVNSTFPALLGSSPSRQRPLTSSAYGDRVRSAVRDRNATQRNGLFRTDADRL